MFWSKNKKNRYTPAFPSCYIKVGYKGVYIAWTCYSDKQLQLKALKAAGYFGDFFLNFKIMEDELFKYIYTFLCLSWVEHEKCFTNPFGLDSVRRPVIDQGPVMDQLVVIGY